MQHARHMAWHSRHHGSSGPWPPLESSSGPSSGGVMSTPSKRARPLCQTHCRLTRRPRTRSVPAQGWRRVSVWHRRCVSPQVCGVGCGVTSSSSSESRFSPSTGYTWGEGEGGECVSIQVCGVWCGVTSFSSPDPSSSEDRFNRSAPGSLLMIFCFVVVFVLARTTHFMSSFSRKKGGGTHTPLFVGLQMWCLSAPPFRCTTPPFSGKLS